MNAPTRLNYRVLDTIVNRVGTVLLGKEKQIRLALACLLAKGHLLIEDLPGMGKTTLAQALAEVLGLDYKRVQFTSDLLPADILGVSIFDTQEQKFTFHPGPVFCQLLLADEINRTTPKTQSALLEAMAEGQVTTEGKTRILPTPFFVIATQNPASQAGTFPLPESQQDRFMLRISMGYPDPESERQLLSGGDQRLLMSELKPCLKPVEFVALQNRVATVKVTDPVIHYLQRLVQYTRTAQTFDFGLSPRASLAILQCARAWAVLEGRDYVIPEDIQTVFPAVAGHRLQTADDASHSSGALVEQVLNSVDIL